VQPFESVLLIANPTSGGGKAGRLLGRVAETLASSGRAVQAVRTQQAGDARQAAAQARAGQLIVAFGGDGTVNEVLNGADLERNALAVIPAGTGNVLGKELGMSRRPLRAARQMLDGQEVRFDVGLANGRRFMCVFGAGIDGCVVRLVHERRGGRLTQLHYVPHLVGALLGRARWCIRAEADGRLFADGADQVAAGNTHSYGGPMEMTPAARPDDGLLDVMAFSQRSLLDTLCLVVGGFRRTLHRSPRVLYGRARRVVLTADAQDVPYQVDGEPAGVLPVELTLLPGAARLIVPAGFRPRVRPLPGEGD
jgi:YegS/Rv2252/BmrU family lipid kinase